jgi:hypothetical protein
MRPRATVGRKGAKRRHRKPTRPKLSSAAMTANQPNLSVSAPQEELKRQAREAQRGAREAGCARRGAARDRELAW